MNASSEIDQVETGGDLPFRQLAQALASPCWISDAVGEIQWVNDAWIDYTGAAADRLRAEGLRPLYDAAAYGDVVRRWVAVRAAGVAAEMEFPLRGKDGRLRPFRTRVTPLHDAAGEISHWFGVNTDISAQSETEARLRASEEQWREVFDRAADGIFITDAEGRLVEANAAACAMGHYTRDEILAMSVFELIDPGEREALSDARSRDDSIRDWRIRRKDGSLLATEVTSRRLSDGRRLGVARDVSARRRAEAAERQALAAEVTQQRARAGDAERRLQRFWDASRDLFAIVDNRDGVPRLINEHAWEVTLGYPAAHILRTRLYDLIHPDDLKRTMRMGADHPDGATYFGFENRYRRSDGGWAWLSWNVVRDGALSYCSARDFTQEREAREELEHANARLAHTQKMEAIGQLTGGVAHDFNNLLMVMGGQAELLRGRVGEDRRVLRSLDAIAQAAHRGQALTRHLLAFSRRQRLRPTAVSLGERLALMQPLLTSSLGAAVALRVECPPELWTVKIDVDEWELAILNMALNARDAMPSGGQLTIAARNLAADGMTLAKDFVELTVTDTGVGIAPDVLAKAIEPFFTTKDVNKGTGLGLSQVDGFVQQSGGRLGIESVLGKGATIRILLPRAAESPPRAAEPEAAARPQRLDILCVEDNPDVAEVTAGLLEELGHDARVASSAPAAMQLLETGPTPDLVLSDIVMAGDFNGLGLARRIRAKWPTLPVLLVTGYSREAEAIGEEFPILAKPYQLGDLGGAVRAVADRAGAAPA